MSNHWLRLWHDMPNDPKWRTIARVSNQPLALVQAMYVHLLVDASRNVTRGHINVTLEDLSSALDCDMSQIEAIHKAMQGRVLEGNVLTGWEARQPKREDSGNPETGAKSAAQRKREQRARQAEKAEKEACHETSRNVTTDTDTDTDKDTEYKTPPTVRARESADELPTPPDTRKRFAMTDDWEPSPQSFEACLHRNGLSGQALPADQLLEFRSFWISRPEQNRTQDQWEHALAQRFKRYVQNFEGKPNETNRQGAAKRSRNAVDVLNNDNW